MPQQVLWGFLVVLLKGMSGSLLCGFVLGVFVAAPVLSAETNSINEFFPKNGVLDPLGARLETVEQTEYKILPEMKPKVSPEEAKPQVQVGPSVPVKQNVNADLTSPQAVVEAFGDPGKDAPVLAQDNAPKPFKAMMAAFEIGDEKLAQAYARQWVRYIKTMGERAEKVVAVTQHEMRREAMIAEDPEAEDPFDPAVKNGVKQELEKQFSPSYVGEIDPRLRKLISKAESEERVAAQHAAMQGKLGGEEAQARAKVREALKSRIKPDPQGKVDVYFFFDPKDKNAIAMVPVLRALLQLSSKDKRIQVIPLTLPGAEAADVQNFKSRSSLSIEILDGSKIAQHFGVKDSPTSIFVGKTKGNMVVEQGVRPVFYVDELIKVLQGGGVKS